jgi:hypothetical protein
MGRMTTAENERNFETSPIGFDRQEPTKPLKPKFTEIVRMKEELKKKQEEEERLAREERAAEKLENRKKLKKNVKKMFVYLLTNFGMVALVLGYIYLGAVIFQILEQPTEIQNCETGKTTESAEFTKYAGLFFK